MNKYYEVEDKKVNVKLEIVQIWVLFKIFFRGIEVIIFKLIVRYLLKWLQTWTEGKKFLSIFSLIIIIPLFSCSQEIKQAGLKLFLS